MLGCDMSNPLSPNHYKADSGDLEAIDVIEKFGLNYRLGNVVKYLLRAGKKDDKRQDLEKALAYLYREVHGAWPDDARDARAELDAAMEPFNGPAHTDPPGDTCPGCRAETLWSMSSQDVDITYGYIPRK